MSLSIHGGNTYPVGWQFELDPLSSMGSTEAAAVRPEPPACQVAAASAAAWSACVPLLSVSLPTAPAWVPPVLIGSLVLASGYGIYRALRPAPPQSNAWPEPARMDSAVMTYAPDQVAGSAAGTAVQKPVQKTMTASDVATTNGDPRCGPRVPFRDANELAARERLTERIAALETEVTSGGKLGREASHAAVARFNALAREVAEHFSHYSANASPPASSSFNLARMDALQTMRAINANQLAPLRASIIKHSQVWVEIEYSMPILTSNQSDEFIRDAWHMQDCRHDTAALD